MRRHLSGISAAFVSVTTLFFAWGFITSNNDPLIASLKAMIPSENNKKVIEELLADAAYAGKLKQLDIEEE